MEVQMPEESNGQEPAQSVSRRGRRNQWLIGMGLGIFAWVVFLLDLLMNGPRRITAGGFFEGFFILDALLIAMIIIGVLLFKGLGRVIIGFLTALILVPLLLFGLCFVAIPFL